MWVIETCEMHWGRANLVDDKITLSYCSLRNFYQVFSAQADRILTHTNHKDTEWSIMEAYIILDGVALIMWSPNEWSSVYRVIPVSAHKILWTSNKPAKWTPYIYEPWEKVSCDFHTSFWSESDSSFLWLLNTLACYSPIFHESSQLQPSREGRMCWNINISGRELERHKLENLPAIPGWCFGVSEGLVYDC
jgi:hypothetical protein